jgi:hypothetical protein
MGQHTHVELMKRAQAHDDLGFGPLVLDPPQERGEQPQHAQEPERDDQRTDGPDEYRPCFALPSPISLGLTWRRLEPTLSGFSLVNTAVIGNPVTANRLPTTQHLDTSVSFPPGTTQHTHLKWMLRNQLVCAAPTLIRNSQKQSSSRWDTISSAHATLNAI